MEKKFLRNSARKMGPLGAQEADGTRDFVNFELRVDFSMERKCEEFRKENEGLWRSRKLTDHATSQILSLG